MRIVLVLQMFALLILSCSKEESKKDDPVIVVAKYVLPYPVGKAYMCSQGFNSSYSHYGSFSYSVDFDMPIGTVVTAARAGRVVYIVENYPDNELIAGHENIVIVMHDDGTYARYVHLTTDGALVAADQDVGPGDIIGLSGSSGESSHPHLHFDVTATFDGRSDQTIPFDFTNINSHPLGLKQGVVYEALGY
jgi:murein DD-endopeptidase MepM/ murein hydrolase activator NlpD